MQISRKNSLIIAFGVILIGIFVFIFIEKKTVYVIEPSKKIVKEVISGNNSVSFDTTACYDAEVKLFLSEFIKNFNTNKASNINQFIDKNNGLAVFLRDGYYPILSFPNKIDDWIEWFDFEIYNNVKFENFPEYLGDNEFGETGFFYVNYKNKFNLDDFDDTYTNLSVEDKKPYRNLEKECNYRADVMSIDGRTVLTMYFCIYKGKKKLVGITQDSVADVLFANPEKEFVQIDTKEQVETFLLDHKKFCDLENKAYIDFDKKELIYCDFGEDPFPFAHYKIGSVENVSKKIKIREIKFFNSDENDGLTLRLSNKGTFTSYQMGARPQYIYEKCE